jgi:pyruvate dehydrogenase E2 component (dihydrolipoamide acetyltransferase)
MAEFRMPSLGADMEAGTLLEWKVKPGDRVNRGDIIAVVDTQKAAIEVETFVTGVVEKLLVAEGTRVPVDTVLATIRTDEEPSRPRAERRARVSPAARKRARELSVAPDRIDGTGEGGAVTLDDVERAARPAPPGPEAVTAALPADRRADVMRAMAAAMSRAKKEIPHYYLSTTIDLGPAMVWLTAENASRPVERRILPGVLLLKGTALALKEVPELNGFYVDGTLRRADSVHLGSAVSLRGGGIIAPAIRDADQKSLDEIMRSVADLVQRARSGTLKSSELSDSTVTVTSLGDRGSDVVFGVIYPPQVALVGFGRIVERPWVAAGQVIPRPTVVASLSADHRASDGHRGAAFLRALDRTLQQPEAL